MSGSQEHNANAEMEIDQNQGQDDQVSRYFSTNPTPRANSSILQPPRLRTGNLPRVNGQIVPIASTTEITSGETELDLNLSRSFHTINADSGLIGLPSHTSNQNPRNLADIQILNPVSRAMTKELNAIASDLDSRQNGGRSHQIFDAGKFNNTAALPATISNSNTVSSSQQQNENGNLPKSSILKTGESPNFQHFLANLTDKNSDLDSPVATLAGILTQIMCLVNTRDQNLSDNITKIFRENTNSPHVSFQAGTAGGQETSSTSSGTQNTQPLRSHPQMGPYVPDCPVMAPLEEAEMFKLYDVNWCGWKVEDWTQDDKTGQRIPVKEKFPAWSVLPDDFQHNNVHIDPENWDTFCMALDKTWAYRRQITNCAQITQSITDGNLPLWAYRLVKLPPYMERCSARWMELIELEHQHAKARAAKVVEILSKESRSNYNQMIAGVKALDHVLGTANPGYIHQVHMKLAYMANSKQLLKIRQTEMVRTSGPDKMEIDAHMVNDLVHISPFEAEQNKKVDVSLHRHGVRAKPQVAINDEDQDYPRGTTTRLVPKPRQTNRSANRGSGGPGNSGGFVKSRSRGRQDVNNNRSAGTNRDRSRSNQRAPRGQQNTNNRPSRPANGNRRSGFGAPPKGRNEQSFVSYRPRGNRNRQGLSRNDITDDELRQIADRRRRDANK